MKNTSKKNSGIIVAFHTGRGGRFYNAGHTTFIGEKSIDVFTSDLFIRFENENQVIPRIQENSILAKFESDILDAMSNNDLETLAEYGISKEELGNRIYYTSGGHNTGLDVENDGTGCIDIDGEYNTTAACFIEDCSENEIELIIKNNDYKSAELCQYIVSNWPELVEGMDYDKYGCFYDKDEDEEE